MSISPSPKKPLNSQTLIYSRRCDVKKMVKKMIRKFLNPVRKMSKNRAGLTLGLFFAILHAFWALAVLVGVAKTYLDWILPMHFIGIMFDILPFSIVNALILVVIAFIAGYVCGWIFAALWNWMGKCCKK